jgi:hypothetical protein
MTTLTNTHITNFDDKLQIYYNTFLKPVTTYGGLLEEVRTIKSTGTNNDKIVLPTESEMVAPATVYTTAQFSNFIRNIINFEIKNFDTLDNTGSQMNFVKNTPDANGAVYAFNDNIKTHIIETLKVINVFVDILEAYKFCIKNNNANDSNIPHTGYTSQMLINRIELVSDTSRFYDNGTMYPSKFDYKNVGYIRNLNGDGAASPPKTVLYLSIESFYTGMSAPYNYDNCFDKSKESGSGAMVNEIDNTTKFFPDSSRTDPITPITLSNFQYARQAYNGKPSEDPTLSGLTLDERNKALVKSLLKTLLNLDPIYRDTSVKALYYYYKFVQLYSTLIINASNVMYANVEVSGTNPKRIETRNMTTKNTERRVSGIEITNSVAGRDYIPTSPAIEFALTIAAAPASGTTAAATCTVTDYSITKGTNIVSITTPGKGYLTAPSVIATATKTAAVAEVAASTGKAKVDAKPEIPAAQASFKATIVPIAIEDTATTQDYNLVKMQNVMLDITNTLTDITTTDLASVAETLDLEITTTDSSTPASVSSSTDFDKKVVINITNPTKYSSLKTLNNAQDLVKDYIIYDKKNKQYYFILKVMDNAANNFKITIDAVFEDKDLPSQEKRDKTILFRDATKIPIVPTFTDASPSINIPSTDAYLVIIKKDINAHKDEYITNREVVYKLDENIKFNTTKVEHHKNLYETQYNKNVFLNRQIISYTTIIGAIILMLVAINLFNIEKQLVKTISLASLGAILLLFAIYFISNITYIEAFLSNDANNPLYNASAEYLNANSPIKASTSLKKTAKILALKNEIDKQNVKFIGFFEKIIITLPAADSADFYSEIKDVITNDRDNKMYIDRMLEINKVQGTNDMDTLKYEIEQNKLYIIVLLVSSIVFITLYNIYINYISNDKYLSLMLFICAIILIVIVSYYIINSNRRVRTVYKSIYWGPENSVNF